MQIRRNIIEMLTNFKLSNHQIKIQRCHHWMIVCVNTSDCEIVISDWLSPEMTLSVTRYFLSQLTAATYLSCSVVEVWSHRKDVRQNFSHTISFIWTVFQINYYPSVKKWYRGWKYIIFSDKIWLSCHKMWYL